MAWNNLNLKQLTSGMFSRESLNSNFDKIEDGVGKQLERYPDDYEGVPDGNAMHTELDMNGNRIINYTTLPTADNDLTNKAYVDARDSLLESESIVRDNNLQTQIDGNLSAIQNIEVSGTIKQDSEEFTATLNQTDFTLTSATFAGDNTLAVYINGVRQSHSSYTTFSTDTVIFSEGLQEGDKVLLTVNESASTTLGVNQIVGHTVNSLEELLSVNPTVSSTVFVKDYHSDVEGGGGVFVWDATQDKANHNGGTIIDPSVAFPTDWTNQTQVASWFTAETGTGVWRRQYDGDVEDSWFGAKTTADSTFSISKAMLLRKDVEVVKDVIPYTTLSGISDIALNDISLESVNSVIGSSGSNNSKVTDTKIARTSNSSLNDNHILAFSDNNNTIVKDTVIENINGTGTALISYSSDPLVKVKDITYADVKVTGDFANSLNTNGVLIADGDTCIMSNIRAYGIHDFAVEYKNETRNSIISNAIIDNSNQGVGFGQTTTGTTDVSSCAVSTVVVNNSDIGVILGDADYNSFSNVNITRDTSPGLSPDTGVRTSGVSEGNTLVGVNISGNISEPIRYGATSLNNYVSSAVHTTGNTVIHESGSTRNVTEITHPGARTRVVDSINNLSTNDNPTYCHATGEYVGLIGNYWHWKKNDAGLVGGASYSKWVYEDTGTAFLSIVTDGAGENGLSVHSPSGVAQCKFINGDNYWGISGKNNSYQYRFYSSTFRGISDNIINLGSASNRFNTVYAGTGTINTSDARLKTFEDIEQAESECAIELKGLMRKFKFNDAIKEKGSKARIHFGVSAQEVQATFKKYGLHAEDYALFCYDEWEDQYEMQEVSPAVLDEEGNIIEEAVERNVLVTPAGNRYGIRYEELLCFIMSTI